MGYCTIHLSGRLGQDPETRFTQSGQAVTTVTLAVDQYQGRGEKLTNWFKLTFWGDRWHGKDGGNGGVVANLHKGDPIFVGGPFKQTSWTGKDGTERTTLEVNVQDFSFAGGNKPNGEGGEERQPVTTGRRQAKPAADNDWDED